MEIWNLIRCEFIKHFSWKKNIIILIVLIITCLGLDTFQKTLGDKRNFSRLEGWNEVTLYKQNFEVFEKANEEDNNLINEIIYKTYIKLKEPQKQIEKIVGNSNKKNWYDSAFYELEHNTLLETFLEVLSNNNQDEINYLEKWYKSYNGTYNKMYGYITAKQRIMMEYIYNYYSNYKNNSNSEINDILSDIKENNNKLKQAIKENKYYLYIDSKCEIDKEKKDIDYNKYCEYFKEKKIEKEYDYRSLNANQFIKLSETHNDYINSNFSYTNLGYDYMNNDIKAKQKYFKKLDKVIIEEKLIAEYAMNHNIKHDYIMVDGNTSGYAYSTTQSYMNLALNLGIVLTVIMAITNSGIMAKEHDKGTIKLLLTKPVKRSKVLISKMLYLTIDLYIWWIIGSIIMMIIGIINCGITDLFTNKLIVINGSVKEINYFIWYLKEMIICSIPIISLLSLLFMISTLLLSTALSASINSILSIFSISIYFLIATFNVRILIPFLYTPIPYLDYYLVRYHNLYYMQSISYTMLSDNYGLIMSIITTIILLTLTISIYNKKDITN